MRRGCRLYRLASAVALPTIAALICFSASRAVAQPERPSLDLLDLNGSQRSLATAKGKIVVLNFWATWCLPCREEMPLLERLSRDYADRNVLFVAASTDDESTQPLIPEAISEAGVTFDVWVGATTIDMKRFDVGAELPATAIIDRDGSVAHRLIGVVDEDELREKLDLLLGARAGREPPPVQSDSAVDVDECCAQHEEVEPSAHSEASPAHGDARAEDAHGHHDRGHDHAHARDHGDADASTGDASLVPS